MRRAKIFLAFLVVAITIGTVFALNIKKVNFRAETLYYYSTTTTTTGKHFFPIPCVKGSPDNCPFHPRYEKVDTGYKVYNGQAMATGG